MLPAIAPAFRSSAECDALRAFLEGAGYHEDASTSPPSAECVTARDALSLLFLHDASVRRELVVAALGADAVELLTRVGLLESTADQLRATARLVPSGTRWIASDRPERHQERAMDFVVGPSPVAQLLSDVTIRRSADRCLDLGCGSGFQALRASVHCRHVVAADVNPRAAAFARFNVALNGLDNVEVVEGDLFAPVHGRQFDLVVCNPPYVLSPASTFTYRDGGDAICARIVREAPAHLADGGTLQMLCNWPQRANTDWRSSVSSWFEGSTCDAWVLRLYSLDRPSYATLWLSQEFRGEEVPAAAFQQWTGYLEALEIESVAAGVVLMRPAVGRTPRLEVREAPRMTGTTGESIARTLAARTLSAGASDEELLAARLVPSPDLEQRTRHRPAGDGWEFLGTELQLARGLTFSARVDPVATALIGLMDGTRTLRDTVQHFADSRNVASAPFLEHLPTAMRRLLDLGLVLPA